MRRAGTGPAASALALVFSLAPTALLADASCPAGSAPAGGGSGYVAPSTTKYNGQVVGNGQCAVFVEAADPGIGQVSTWKPGEQVQGATDIPIGTAIATFNFNGSYGSASNPAGVSGQSHTGLYMGQNAQGVVIEDQYVGKPVTTHVIPWSQWSGGTAEAGNKYYVVQNPNASSGGSSSGTPSTTSGTSTPATASGTGSPASACTPTQAATTASASSPSASTQGTLSTTATGASPTGAASGSTPTPTAQRPGVSLDFSGYQSGDSTGTQDFTVGDPKTCWICDAAMYALGIVEAVGASGPPAIVALMWPTMVVLAALGLALTAARAVASGADPSRPSLRFLARMAVVGAVLSGGSMGTMGASGGSGGSILFDYVLSPPINVGASIGSDLADIASSVLTVGIEPGNCSYVDAATAKVVQLKDASDSLMKLLCKIHVAAATGIDLGAQVSIHSGSKETQMDQATAVVVTILGSTVMILSMLAMVNFAFAVLEVILKIGIVSAFLPIFAFAWLFESTRGMVRVIFDSMLFSVVYLSMCGISSVVGVYVMMESFSFGLGQNGSSVSSAGLLSQFDSVASSMNLDSGTGLSQVALLVGFSLAGTLMAVRLLGASHDMAVDLTGFALGRSGEMSKIGSKLVSSAVGMGAAGGGLIAAVGGRAAGAAAGSLSGVGRAGLARAGSRR